jgi:hypothetical protein
MNITSINASPRRERLPNRREQRLVAFEYEGRAFTAGSGVFPDGRIGEVFLDCDRPDSLTAALARDAGSDGRAAGPLGRALDGGSS